MKTKDIVQIALMTAIIFVLSLIKIPIGGVPITMQTLGVMLAGTILGSKKGGLAALVYTLTQFAKLSSYTGGFLISFPIAAFLIGLALEKTNYKVNTIFIVNTIFGVLLVYAIGLPWFMNITGYNLNASLVGAVYPFIPGDMLKVVVTAIVSPRLIEELKKINS